MRARAQKAAVKQATAKIETKGKENGLTPEVIKKIKGLLEGDAFSNRASRAFPTLSNGMIDPFNLKIWEKARRIGATYVQAFEDVMDCAREGGCAVWFTSADQATAMEYIRSCAHWGRILETLAQNVGEVALDEDKGVKVLASKFKNGKRIHAFPSTVLCVLPPRRQAHHHPFRHRAL